MTTCSVKYVACRGKTYHQLCRCTELYSLFKLAVLVLQHISSSLSSKHLKCGTFSSKRARYCSQGLELKLHYHADRIQGTAARICQSGEYCQRVVIHRNQCLWLFFCAMLCFFPVIQHHVAKNMNQKECKGSFVCCLASYPWNMLYRQAHNRSELSCHFIQSVWCVYSDFWGDWLDLSAATVRLSKCTLCLTVLCLLLVSKPFSLTMCSSCDVWRL